MKRSTVILIFKGLFAVALPAAFLVGVGGSLLTEAETQLDPAKYAQPAPYSGPLIVTKIDEPGFKIPTVIESFAEQNNLSEQDREKLENIYSQYETEGEMTDQQRLNSLGKVLNDLAAITVNDSVTNHGFLADSEAQEVKFLRSMATLMLK